MSASRVSAFRATARHAARALAAAVYVAIALGLLTSWTHAEAWTALALEAVLVAFAAAVLARVTDVPVWLAALVGFWCATLDLALALLLGAEDLTAEAWAPLALRTVLILAAGVAGAAGARRLARPSP